MNTASPGVGRRGAARDDRAGKRRKRVRTPLFLQYEEAECGAACLGSLLAHFGRWVSINELRKACGVSRDGSTMLDVAKAARGYGLEVDAWRKDTGDLADMRLPVIVFWEFNHFLVLEGMEAGKYYLNDPANGRRVVDEETFDQAFTGVAMEMRPGPDFVRGGSRRSVLQRAWPWLRSARSTLAFALACGFLTAVVTLLSPVLLTVFVDDVLGEGARGYWGRHVVAASLALAVLAYMLAWMQQRSLHRLAIRLSAVQAEGMISHLFRLPAKFFVHRSSGDLAVRVHSVDMVASVMSTQYVAVMIELLMSCLFLVLMVAYDPWLSVVVVVLSAANAVLTRSATKRRNDENQQMRHELASLAGVTVSGLSDIEHLRASAGENDLFGRWSGYQARELTARQKFAEMGYITMSLPNLFSLLGAAAVFGLGSLRVESGDMTTGALMGFYILAVSFLQPVGRLVQSIDAFQMLEVELDRFEDITTAQVDPLFAASGGGGAGGAGAASGSAGAGSGGGGGAGAGSGSVGSAPGVASGGAGSALIATLNGKLQLIGRLEMRDVTFGYNPNKDPLVEDFNLAIEPGQRVAVIGATGSGKSTLLKLAVGEYTPWSGEVLFDGVPVHGIPRQVFTDSVSVVDQHIYLYSGTIRENLTMWNPAVPDHRIIAAARDAMIHKEIMSRPSGYDSGVTEGGSNFSHGQRQRLEIARALTSDPSVLLLDEATSKLDAVTEMHIDIALRRRGCTSLVVAHRLTTIKDSDQIVVLDKGRVAQRGTHDELIADHGGLYSPTRRTRMNTQSDYSPDVRHARHQKSRRSLKGGGRDRCWVCGAAYDLVYGSRDHPPVITAVGTNALFGVVKADKTHGPKSMGKARCSLRSSLLFREVHWGGRDLKVGTWTI